MTESVIYPIIVSLIILAFGLALKVAQLSHRLKLLEEEYQALQGKHSKSQIENEEAISKIKELELPDVFSSGVHIRNQ